MGLRLQVEVDKKAQNKRVAKNIEQALKAMVAGIGVTEPVTIQIRFVDHGALPRTPRGKIALRIGDERK